MLKKGNGTPQQCAANLLKLNQGEVFYSRLKGLTTEAVDKPAPEAAELLQEQAEWLIETYEPRFEVSGIEIKSFIEENIPVENIELNGITSEG